jgi:hypothetical protein
MDTPETFRGRYQESLQLIGAWLDIRGFRNLHIVESDGELVVEASDTQGEPAVVEKIRLGFDLFGR